VEKESRKTGDDQEPCDEKSETDDTARKTLAKLGRGSSDRGDSLLFKKSQTGGCCWATEKRDQNVTHTSHRRKGKSRRRKGTFHTSPEMKRRISSKNA